MCIARIKNRIKIRLQTNKQTKIAEGQSCTPQESHNFIEIASGLLEGK